MTGSWKALAMACVAWLLAGCAINPVTGRPEVVLISAEREKEMGAKASKQVEEQLGLVKAPALERYVSELGQRLAAHSPWQEVGYRFFVVEMEEPNAFALPAGYVYVSRGLLALTNSEAELAGAMAHEIGHVAARHAVQRQTRAAGIGILALPGALVGAVVSPAGDFINAPVAVLGGGLLASYSRDQEREADEVGQQMAADAGIDPAGLARFLETLEEATTAPDGETRSIGFFDSHPSTPERVASAGERAKEIAWTPQPAIAGDRASFLARIEGLLVGPDPAQGVFRETLFLHPDLGFSMRFPTGWKVVNTARAAGAVSPERDGTYLLELSGKGSDPRAAATADLQKLALEVSVQVVDSGPVKVGRLSGFRAHLLAETSKGTAPLDVTWVALGGAIYRLMGTATASKFDGYQALFRQTAQSFRQITSAERASITATRLRVVQARDGETLAQLSRRSGNAWELRDLAVANRLAEDARLRRGQLVKVIVAEPYR